MEWRDVMGLIGDMDILNIGMTRREIDKKGNEE